MTSQNSSGDWRCGCEADRALDRRIDEPRAGLRSRHPTHVGTPEHAVAQPGDQPVAEVAQGRRNNPEHAQQRPRHPEPATHREHGTRVGPGGAISDPHHAAEGPGLEPVALHQSAARR